jgi:prepilin-type N-terminal cleavage/methylation domain-containing protein
MRQSKPGLTLVEIVMAAMILAIFIAIAIPAFQAMLQRSQLDAAVRQIMSDAREAQSRASLTGWQFRLVGFDKDSSNAFKNQYRLLGRSSAAVAWPADSSPNISTATQLAAQWVNVNSVYPGVKLDTSDATNRFYVTFNAQGAAFEINSFPLEVSHTNGEKKCVGATAAGSMRIVGCP